MAKIQLHPDMNIGMVGHVDHGKTTLIEKLSGKWTSVHSEELKRGITIRLGYADAVFYKSDKYKDAKGYGTIADAKKDKSYKPVRMVSFIDAPGHETLMATMLSGAAIMDAAILTIAANELCPQPQTKEHLMALEIIGIKNIIIVQNKIDLVTEKEAIENYNQIKNFIKGTIAESSPIIPISAQQNVNIDVLIKTIMEKFNPSKINLKKQPLMLVARSFDVNKPGSDVIGLKGGVLGGTLKEGVLKIGDKIEIKPGIRIEKDGKTKWKPIVTEIEDLRYGNEQVNQVTPGGSIGVSTKLDPTVVKNDNLAGNLVGFPDTLPTIWYDFWLETKLLERVVGTKDNLLVEPLKRGENLMLNVNSSATIGIIDELKKDKTNKIHINLKLPVCASEKDRITISRLIGSRFRLIGYGNIVK